MFKALSILENEKCYEEVHSLRWPNGVACTHYTAILLPTSGFRPLCQEENRGIGSSRSSAFRTNFCIIPKWIQESQKLLSINNGKIFINYLV